MKLSKPAVGLLVGPRWWCLGPVQGSVVSKWGGTTNNNEERKNEKGKKGRKGKRLKKELKS